LEKRLGRENEKQKSSSLWKRDLGEKMKNKKGMELMVETYVVIILALLVAVVLIIIWDIQTGKFTSYIKEIMGKSNVDSSVAACNSLVARQATYEYCCSAREVRYEVNGSVEKEEMTCSELSAKEFGANVEKMNCKEAGCQE
jgi:hypothetical protein